MGKQVISFLVLLALPLAFLTAPVQNALGFCSEEDRYALAWQVGDLAVAEDSARVLVKNAEEEHGLTHPLVARRLTALAMVLEHRGDLNGALLLHERALHIDEKTFGTSSSMTALRLNNIA